jgi:hypothetical protein
MRRQTSSRRSPDGQASPTHTPLVAQDLSLLVVLLEGANPAPLQAVVLPAVAKAAQALAAAPATVLVGLPRAAGPGTVLVGLPRAVGPGTVLTRALLAPGAVLPPTLNLCGRCAGSDLIRKPLTTCSPLMPAGHQRRGGATQTWRGRSGALYGASFWAAVVRCGSAHVGETCAMRPRLAPISHGTQNADMRLPRRR